MCRTILIVILLGILPGVSLRADEITLKDGKTIYGTIIKETRKTIIILTKRGKQRIHQSKVETVIENTVFGDEEIDKKVSEIDADDPDQLAEVAKWAKDQGNRGWKMVAWKVKKMDPENDLANELLGWHKAGDRWYQTKKEAEKAMREALKEEMEANGYVFLKKGKQQGWVKKEDKKLVLRNTKDWMVDDEDMIWKPIAEVMAKRGYVKIGDKWIKASPRDLKDMEKYKKLTGDEIVAITSKHFRLFVAGYTPEKVQEFAEMCEMLYEWFLQEMEAPADFNLFRGNKGTIWVLKDKNAVLEWFKYYAQDYGLGDSARKLLERGGGNLVSPGRLLATNVPPQNRDVRQTIAHDVGMFLITYFSPGLKGTRPWLAEAWGHLAEEKALGQGYVCCSTLTNYGGSGGLADKEFTTADAGDSAKGLVRSGEDISFDELEKTELNQLDGRHYAKGFTLMKWLLKDHKKELIAWLKGMNRATTTAALAKAFGGWTTHELDKRWREWVKKTF